MLAAKAALREDVWSAMRAAKVARFPGAAGRIPNFTGAEAAAQRLRGLPAWQAARTVKANPDSAQLPVRQRALEDGKTVYMAVPRLAEPEPFFALDPDHLDQPPRKAASISGASRSARRVTLDELTPVDLVVMGSVAAGEDGARLGKGGGFADLEFALATAAGLIGPRTVTVTTVHEIQVRPAGTIPLTGHDVPVDFVVTPERVIDCRAGWGCRAPPPGSVGRPDRGEDRGDPAAVRAARGVRRCPTGLTADDGDQGPGAEVDAVAGANGTAWPEGTSWPLTGCRSCVPRSTTDQLPSGPAMSSACRRETPGSVGGPVRSISGSMRRDTLRRPMRTSAPVQREPALWDRRRGS